MAEEKRAKKGSETGSEDAKAGKTGPAKEGDKVKVHYIGTFEDGKPFDSSEGRDPIAFTIGEHHVVPGFEKAVAGMKVGEKKDITLEPEDGYGEPRAELMQEVPMEAMKKSGITPEVGMTLGIAHPQAPGQQLPAKVVAIGEETVKLDLNHPLAGKKLKFTLELAGIE